MSCAESPCCTHVQLQTMEFSTLMDVDYATYLLNFEGIILQMAFGGTKAKILFHQPCRYLDQPTGLCTVHGTPTQPSICAHYNPYNCGYRHRLTVEVDPEVPLVDRRRMAWFCDRLAFDDERRVVGMPKWEEVLEAFESMPLDRSSAPPPIPRSEEWQAVTVVPANGPRRFDDPVISKPCQNCVAWCCKTLVFSRKRPRDASELDEFRFCSGFPGVEVGYADDGWALIVRTVCRHLDGNRCSVFGTDERPLRCSYYDEMQCDYRPRFELPKPADMVLLDHQGFAVLMETVVLDEFGKILAVPPANILRSMIEDAQEGNGHVKI
jgi:hypothetical protein